MQFNQKKRLHLSSGASRGQTADIYKLYEALF